jgi:hypothetical protein
MHNGKCNIHLEHVALPGYFPRTYRFQELNSYFIKAVLILLLYSTLLSSPSIKAQSQKHTMKIENENSLLEKSILPGALISMGLLFNYSTFEKQLHTDIRNKVGNDFEYRIDDYIQYAPVAEMYIADALGIKAKNHWFDQTKYLLISQIISSTITHTIKRTTLKERPNGAKYSFPSGHTTFAFNNAAVLFKEFQHSSLILAYSGYTFTISTGAFRMINNKHWLSDVLVGAGIGIFITELVYYLEPFKNFNPFKKYKNITFSPQFIDNKLGVYIAYKL